LLLLLSSLLPLAPAHAAQGDRQQPIEVQADRSEFDQQTGRQVHSGDVLISQGSLNIRADEIVIFLEGGALSHIEASGQPVSFSQLDDAGQAVTARSQQMRYEATSGLLLLTGNASLSQTGRELSGQRIEYNVNSQRVSADGGETERVRILIQPPPPATGEAQQ
jgi:lipopolysaccharide export system protein LptA